MIRRPPRSTPKPSSAASDVYKRQVSGGPIVDSPDNGESSTDFIGYVGGSLALTDSIGAYGEFSVQTDETADNAYGVKVGAKYTF